jgi:hypothetical protein
VTAFDHLFDHFGHTSSLVQVRNGSWERAFGKSKNWYEEKLMGSYTEDISEWLTELFGVLIPPTTLMDTLSKFCRPRNKLVFRNEDRLGECAWCWQV